MNMTAVNNNERTTSTPTTSMTPVTAMPLLRTIRAPSPTPTSVKPLTPPPATTSTPTPAPRCRHQQSYSSLTPTNSSVNTDTIGVNHPCQQHQQQEHHRYQQHHQLHHQQHLQHHITNTARSNSNDNSQAYYISIPAMSTLVEKPTMPLTPTIRAPCQQAATDSAHCARSSHNLSLRSSQLHQCLLFPPVP